MPASIVADHDVAAKVCAFLRTYGHRVLEHNQLRREGDRTIGLDDEDILCCAANGGDAVLTRNYRDFRALHDRGAPHFGIIECPDHRNSRIAADAIHAAIQRVLAVHPHLERQCIPVTVPRKRIPRPRRKK